MKDENKLVITIGRQFGSGGCEVGTELAQELGLDFYDKNILRMNSDESGIKESYYYMADERAGNKLLYKIVKSLTPDMGEPSFGSDLISADNLFRFQSEVIRKLAAEEDCIIMGRCADYVLEGMEGLVRVFIYADMDFREKRTIEKEREEIAAYKKEIEDLKSQAKQKQEKIEEQRERILAEAREKANTILRDAKEVADETIKNFHKFGKQNISAAEMEKERERLRKKMKENAAPSGLKSQKPKKAYKPSDFKLGESVKVLSMNLTGTISSLPDSRGNVTVQMGILRSQVPISDLEIIEEVNPYAPKSFKRTSKGKLKMSKSLSVSPEINLLGKTVDEAVAELDKYLDDALLSHLSTVRVVHGKGTGALRKGIHEFLRRQKHVKSYRLGEFGEGDAGVTIVELK